MEKLSGIKVVIWDFDGTFYPQNKAVSAAMEEKQYETIMRHKGWDHAKAKEEFWKVYPSETTSGNAAVGIVTGMSTAQAAVENEIGFDRLMFIQKDGRLPEMFATLKHLRHFVLGNGVKANLEHTVKGLGIEGVFEEIVTSEVVGANKPDPAGYLYIMEKTGCQPQEHLMVGDREAVDLIPAKNVGMHTCLVAWGEGYAELPKTGTSVDITIATPYDLPQVLA
jgi:FMN phosphatase YigB (HAD superfamily)